LTLRKKSKTARVRAELFDSLTFDEFKPGRQLRSWRDDEDALSSPGLYLIAESTQKITYVGSSLNLQRRFRTQFAAAQLDHWERERDAKFIRFLGRPDVSDPIDLLSMQKRLIQAAKPKFNDLGPAAA
jgi:excinuclease UvrABC nuclease subunit